MGRREGRQGIPRQVVECVEGGGSLLAVKQGRKGAGLGTRVLWLGGVETAGVVCGKGGQARRAS